MTRRLAWIATIALGGIACGEPASDVSPAEPISGAALDAIQANVRLALAGEIGESVSEGVRVARNEDGRAVVHVMLSREADPSEHERMCDALSEASASVLSKGQSLEVHFLEAGSVVHSCGL